MDRDCLNFKIIFSSCNIQNQGYHEYLSMFHFNIPVCQEIHINEKLLMSYLVGLISENTEILGFS